MDNLLTIGDLSRRMNTSYARATGIVANVEPALTASNGRVKLYSEESIKAHLFEMNSGLLNFLGYRPLDESYDVVTTD